MSDEFRETKLSKQEIDEQDARDVKRKVIFFVICVILLLSGKFVFGF
jgi:hypothetical protein